LKVIFLIVNAYKRGMTFFFIGSLAEIEVAAERLDKQMNTDLESDCEAVISMSKYKTKRLCQPSTSSSSKSSIEIDGSSTTKTNNMQKKNDNSDHPKNGHFFLFSKTSYLFSSNTIKNTIFSWQQP